MTAQNRILRFSLKGLLILVAAFAGLLAAGRVIWDQANPERVRIRQVLAQLSDADADAELRQQAAIELSILPLEAYSAHPNAAVELLRIAEQDDPMVRREILRVLPMTIITATGNRGKESLIEDALALLKDSLRDSSPEVRSTAANGLRQLFEDRPNASALAAQIDSSAVRPTLIEAVRDADPMVRVPALRALATISPRQGAAPAPLRVALADPHPAVRKVAVEVLGGLQGTFVHKFPSGILPWGDQQAVYLDLAGRLDDEDRQVRQAIYSILSQVHAPPEDAIPIVVRATKPSTVFAERGRLAILGPFDPSVSLPILVSHMESYNPMTRDALYALQQMGLLADPAIPDLIRIARSEDRDQEAVLAIRALASIVPDAEEVRPLIARLILVIEDQAPDSGRDGLEWLDAVSALGDFGPQAREARPVLREALRYDPAYSDHVARAIERIEAGD